MKLVTQMELSPHEDVHEELVATLGRIDDACNMGITSNCWTHARIGLERQDSSHLRIA